MKKRYLLVPILISTLVACNSGGGSGGDTPPGPSPSPTPPPEPSNLLALQLKSIGNPLVLNKIGGNSVWYMLVNNPNSTGVVFSTIDNKNNNIFAEQGYKNYNQDVIHPTQFVESYNGEVAGYSNTPDCLSLLKYPPGPGIMKVGTLSLNGNQSCVYKFRAFWNSNLNQPNNNQVQLDYIFYPEGQLNTSNSYCTTGVSNCVNVIPYDSNNTINYQSYALKSQDNIESQLQMTGLQNTFAYATLFTYSGNKVFGWTQANPLSPQPDQITTSVYSYDLNYNSSTNTLSKSNLTTFTNFGMYQTYNFNFTNSSWVSQLGDNFGALFWLNTTPTGNHKAVNGSNGSTMLVSQSFQLLTSTNGNFTSGYSTVGSIPVGYNLTGWDETNNIITMTDGRIGGNSYCYNLNTQQSKRFSYSNVNTLYMPNSVSSLVGIINYNNELYVRGSGFYYQGQNGQYIYNTKNSNQYKFDSINCTLTQNSVMPFNIFTKNNNYGTITNTLNQGTTPTVFVASNSNMF